MHPINLSTRSGIFRWRPAAWLHVHGDDAATFLQGQFTQDLRGLTAGQAVYGLWLTLKGKVLADSFVIAGPTPREFWIGSYFSTAGIIRERLESHIIADDVTMEDQTRAWCGLSVLGRDVKTRLAAGFEANGFQFPGRRAKEPNIELVYPADAPEPEWVGSLDSLEAAEMERRRIQDGVPAVPIDVGPADLPNEAGLEADAISFTKGCYLGQEVMARLKSMGQVRRRLVRVRGAGPAPTVSAGVFVNERQVGELRSVAPEHEEGWIGLAMVSRLQVGPETKLSFAGGAAAGITLLDSP